MRRRRPRPAFPSGRNRGKLGIAYGVFPGFRRQSIQCASCLAVMDGARTWAFTHFIRHGAGR